jgi:apolipoprotein N-acyltransferase
MLDRHPLLFALLAGAIAATGFFPLSYWSLTEIGLAVLMALIARAPSLRAAAARGWLWGWAHFTVNCNWIAHAFVYQDNMPQWLGYVAVVGLAAFLALYVMLASVASWWARARIIPFTLVFAAAWVFAEYLRATLFTGFAWNPIGVAMLTNTVRLVIPWIGTYGASLFAIFIAALLRPRGTGRTFAQVAFILALSFTGWLLIQYTPFDQPRVQPGTPLITVVQPDIPEQERHDARADFANLVKMMRLSVPTDPARPRLVLWPEGALSDYVEDEPWARERLAKILAPHDILIAGGDALVFDDTHQLKAARNSFFILNAKGELLGRYDKSHLVPGGEYLPMRAILSTIGLNRLVPGDLDFIPGPGPRTLDVPGFGGVGGMICYEIVFSGHVVDPSPVRRPRFIFNPSSDAWFGAWGPPQHLAQAQMRALEEGLPIVRATPTGISAVIDARGRITMALPAGAQGVLVSAIPRALPRTFFGEFGNAVPLALAMFAGAIGIALARRTR